ncbi:MAG: hypothetical protein J2P54_07485, partial [Bradyrhizobiaceae bacterium]|nr:hypothetical protein [Bradyrhizobiaceae bacterium]
HRAEKPCRQPDEGCTQGISEQIFTVYQSLFANDRDLRRWRTPAGALIRMAWKVLWLPARL